MVLNRATHHICEKYQYLKAEDGEGGGGGGVVRDTLNIIDKGLRWNTWAAGSENPMNQIGFWRYVGKQQQQQQPRQQQQKKKKPKKKKKKKKKKSLKDAL